MTPPRNARFESLDAWRGIACLLVVIYHSTNAYAASDAFLARIHEEGGSFADTILVFTSKLWAGVPIFFVISGYCIAATADASRSKPRPAVSFLYRRLRRIYPPLWAYLALCVVLSSLIPAAYWYHPSLSYSGQMFRTEGLSFWNGIGSLTLTEEWRPYLIGPPKVHYSIQLWTLCYEEQFYFIVGIILLVARQWLFPAIALVTVLVFLNIAKFHSSNGFDLTDYQVPADGLFLNGLWLAFAAGVAVYYRANRATPIVARCLELLLFVLFVWSMQGVKEWWRFHSDTTANLAIAFAFAILLCAIQRFDARIAKWRGLAPFRACGQICYSLYLIHMPITLFGSSLFYRAGLTSSVQTICIVVPICMLASILAAIRFHRHIEKRFINKASPAPTA